jgi:hypothetical protein
LPGHFGVSVISLFLQRAQTILVVLTVSFL